MINNVLKLLVRLNSKWYNLLLIIHTIAIGYLYYMIFFLSLTINSYFDKIDLKFKIDDRVFIDNQVQNIVFDSQDIKKAELQKAKILCLEYYEDYLYREKCKFIYDYMDKNK